MKHLLTGLGLFLAVSAFGKAETLRFPANGFTIDALEDTTDGSQPVTVVAMTLPASGGFAPNVNVSIQPFDKTLADYVKLSDSEFKQMQFKVISSKKIDDKTHVWEYSGKTNNMLLHFYAKVVMKGKKAYLTTATATDPQWVFYADKLKGSVDSFKLN